MILLQEHRRISDADLEGLNLDDLRRRVNYDTSRFDASRINLFRYEFDPVARRDGFYSYFRIGAEWIDSAQTLPVVVVPKMHNIDFIEMFMTCLRMAEPSDDFSSIYDIDFDARPIRSQALDSILSPLLVVQYLMTVQRIATRGLRKGYVARSENLSKVKGRIDIRRNQRMNVLAGHAERIFCNFEEYSVDTPENRFLKNALYVARDMISLMNEHRAFAVLSAMCNHCISAFAAVSDDSAIAVPNVKANKLYHDYTEAIRIAGMILRHRDIAVSSHSANPTGLVPVFRIDMALLFEHYALAGLRRVFGRKSVKYQVKGYGGRFIADFLITKGDFRAIVDTKYIDGDKAAVAKPEYIKQLSAYARDMVLLRSLGIGTTDESAIPIVPCVLLYPAETVFELSELMLLRHKVKETLQFYTCPFTIPHK